ncbi:MAG: TrkH family potassium uptake protein [Candidatus Bipolaricaulaceae bacterium]
MSLADLRVVLRDLGLLPLVVAFMAAASFPVALYFHERVALWPLGLTVLAALGLWAIFYWPFRGAGDTELRHGLVVAGIGWLLIPALGGLPLFLTSRALGGGLIYPYADFTNAFFESISGFTGTGLTMALRPDLLPKTLQWWRSLTQWIGGMGVIVLMIAILAGPGVSAAALYYAEARTEKIHPSVRSTVRTMWWIFGLYTVLAALAFFIAGMPPWEALNHAMTGVATGGFSLWPDSLAHYRSLNIEIVAIFAMVVGAVSFVVHYRMLSGGPKVLWGDLQTRWLLLGLLFGAGVTGLNLLRLWPAREAFRTGAFQYVSAMTCTGFQTVDLSRWTEAGKLLLTVGMVVGGAAGSTSGGVKVIRLATLVGGITWQIRKLLAPPDAVVPCRLGTDFYPAEKIYREMSQAAALFFLWVSFLVAGAFLLAQFYPAGRFTLADYLFEVASAQGNVGLSVGITHPAMPTLAKLLLSFHMWAGRLEIIPVLILLRTLLRPR